MGYLFSFSEEPYGFTASMHKNALPAEPPPTIV
jgi:hypothetical protein